MNFFYILYKAAWLWVTRESSYHAAAFSYYAPAALVPLLIFTVSVVGFFYGETFTGNIFESWGSVLGSDLINIIKDALKNMSKLSQVSKVPAIGAFFLLSFCVVALNVLSDGFRKLWGVKSEGFRSLALKYSRSVGFIFILQAYLVVVIGLVFFIIPTFLGKNSLISSAVLFVATLTFFASLYRWLCVTSPDWRACWIGSFVSSSLLVLIKSIVGFYIAQTPLLTVYGGAGLILILLVWVYVFSALVLYGAAVAGLYGKMEE